MDLDIMPDIDEQEDNETGLNELRRESLEALFDKQHKLIRCVTERIDNGINEITATNAASQTRINTVITSLQSYISGISPQLTLKEDNVNKTDDIIDNAVSSIKYPSTVGVVDYVSFTLGSYPTLSMLSGTLANYVTRTSLNTTLLAYPTNASLSLTLLGYPTNIQLSNVLDNYTTNASLTTTLSNYLTTVEVNNALALKQDNLNFTNGIRNSNGTVTPVYGNTANTICQGNDPRFDLFTTITVSLVLVADWIDTGIHADALATGTYIVQLYANDASAGGPSNNEYYTGLMSWYSGNTASSEVMPTDEIVLHRAGASNEGELYLRTFRSPVDDPQKLKLQIFQNTSNAALSNYVFNFRRVI